MRYDIEVWYRHEGLCRSVSKIADYASLSGAKRAAMHMVESYRMDNAFIRAEDGRRFLRIAGEKKWREEMV